MSLLRLQRKLMSQLKKQKVKRRLFLVFLLFLFLLYPLKKPLVRDDYSRVILDKNGEILRVFLTEDEQYCLPPTFNKKVPEKLKKAVVQFEDKYFYYHPGVNPASVLRAIVQNIKKQRVVSGASTINMQLARIRKRRNRKALSKLVEMLEAIRIEMQYKKESVLKMYLDHAPYGGNIIGYQAASWRYFGKPPEKLSWAESCLLAVLPNSPGSVSPVKNNATLLIKRDKLLNELLNTQIIDSTTYRNSLGEDIPTKVLPFDFYAPHLTRRIDIEQPKSLKIVETSIDIQLQHRANGIVKKYARQLGNYGIKNTALLVVDNTSGKVRAYVGSQDFYGEQGKVDGVNAPRSSGSVLKPFLYALSIKEGLVIPESLIQDIPTYYGTFSPHNSSELFDGITTVHDALVRSLNVPAVRMLYTYGHYKFFNFLEQARFSTLYRSADNYGLPLIIGGAEVTLWDMAQGYYGLANLGNFATISYLENEMRDNSSRLIDSASVLMTLEILKDLKRPGSEFYWTKFNSQYPIAWKTGTSYGHKDAWAIGINPQYTVAVWVGNFDATTNKNLSGAGSAGPLLFDVFNALQKDPQKKWWNTSEILTEKQEVCAISGYSISKNCEKTTTVRVPKVDILKQCPYHLKIMVDTTTGFSVCSKCWTGGRVSKSYITYPPLVLAYLRKSGAVIEKIPYHTPNCQANINQELIEVEYPRPGTKIMVSRDFDGEYQPIVFSAAHKIKSQVLYWYLDGRYLGETRDKHKFAVIPEKGNHKLQLFDAYGNTKVLHFFSTHR